MTFLEEAEHRYEFLVKNRKKLNDISNNYDVEKMKRLDKSINKLRSLIDDYKKELSEKDILNLEGTEEDVD